MRVERNREDFPTDNKNTLYAGCYGCCCCSSCFFWIGGLIGGAMGSKSTKVLLEKAKQKPQFETYLTMARTIYWIIFIIIGLVILTIWGLYEGRSVSEDLVITAFASVPASNYLGAAIIAHIACEFRIPDQKAKSLILTRIWKVSVGGLIGYSLGWVLTLMIIH